MKIKLSTASMQELIFRVSLIDSKEKELQIIKAEKKIFWEMLCAAHKLDPSSNYKVNPMEGTLELFEPGKEGEEQPVVLEEQPASNSPEPISSVPEIKIAPPSQVENKE